MTDHADTIRRVLSSLGLVRYGRFERPQAQEGLDALDALVAENQRLRDALEQALGVMGYSAQTLTLTHSAPKVVRHLRSEHSRIHRKMMAAGVSDGDSQ